MIDYFVGADVHVSFTTVRILDGNGRRVKRPAPQLGHSGAARGLLTTRGLRWLAELELPALYAVRRNMLPEDLRMFNRQLRDTEQTLEHYAKRHLAVRLLRTIPGVGNRMAEAIVASRTIRDAVAPTSRSAATSV